MKPADYELLDHTVNTSNPNGVALGAVVRTSGQPGDYQTVILLPGFDQPRLWGVYQDRDAAHGGHTAASRWLHELRAMPPPDGTGMPPLDREAPRALACPTCGRGYEEGSLSPRPGQRRDDPAHQSAEADQGGRLPPG